MNSAQGHAQGLRALTQTRIMAPAVRVATESASQNGDQSETNGRMYDSWPTDWTTANTSAANFWMRRNCARPCAHAGKGWNYVQQPLSRLRRGPPVRVQATVYRSRTQGAMSSMWRAKCT